ncbi:MAG: hypothetical protein HY822_20080 [Acidobacteria bacterium]|nr:hypothetical protein [Acidobacteriota bacterium]
MTWAAWAVFLALVPPPAEGVPEAALQRLSEEAEAFARVAPEVISQEVWRQKAAKGRGFHPRIGRAPETPPQFAFRYREIASEYGFATLQKPQPSLHEVRRVVSVDGRPVEGAAEARRKLTLALTAPDDKDRRRLLRDFERWGLEGALTDFGQSLLLFTRRALPNYRFSASGRERVGPDAAFVVAFHQDAGASALTVFDDNRVTHRPLEGRLWLREPDFLPLRLELRTARDRDGQQIVDLAVVDYALSSHGVLLPASVLHRQHQGGRLAVENSLQYGPFRRFAASAEIKFEAEEPAAQRPPQ